jgi:hypothetical protein
METLLIVILFLNICYNCIKICDNPGTSKYFILQNFTLPDGPIYAKGWLKYTTFEKENRERPKEFFKNMGFYQQMKSGVTLDLTQKDSVGYINIPDEENFFFILTENSLNVLSSRKVKIKFKIKNNLARTIDILNVDEIVNNTNAKEFQGGVVDHGDFSEGFCFQIKSINEKKKKDIIWEVCAKQKVKII